MKTLQKIQPKETPESLSKRMSAIYSNDIIGLRTLMVFGGWCTLSAIMDENGITKIGAFSSPEEFPRILEEKDSIYPFAVRLFTPLYSELKSQFTAEGKWDRLLDSRFEAHEDHLVYSLKAQHSSGKKRLKEVRLVVDII